MTEREFTKVKLDKTKSREILLFLTFEWQVMMIWHNGTWCISERTKHLRCQMCHQNFVSFFQDIRVVCHLEFLKPANPERDASSISGVTIFSIISINTVNVGSTMKSMNPAGNSNHARLTFTLYLLTELQAASAVWDPKPSETVTSAFRLSHRKVTSFSFSLFISGMLTVGYGLTGYINQIIVHIYSTAF